MQLDTTTEKKPSLLRQIVDKVDIMSPTEQHKLLLQLNKVDILNRAIELDEKFENAFEQLSIDEIAEMVSKDRKHEFEKNEAN